MIEIPGRVRLPHHPSHWAHLIAGLLLLLSLPLIAAPAVELRYFYDETGQLTKSVDSTGVIIEYVYDDVGNRLESRRTEGVTGLAILDFTPKQGAIGDRVTIYGQHFSTTLADNSITLNGLTAQLESATETELVFLVPDGAATGPIEVTVATEQSTSQQDFTVIPLPRINAVAPAYVVSDPQNPRDVIATLNGRNLAAASYSLLPQFQPVLASVSNVNNAVDGNSSTLTMTLTTDGEGSQTIVAANGFGHSNKMSQAANTLQILSGSGDEDNDGLNNFAEIQAGSDPFNPDSDGDGFSDGAEVADGGDPNDPDSLPQGISNGVVAQRITIQNLALYIPNSSGANRAITKPLSIQNRAWFFVDNSGNKRATAMPISISNKALFYKAADGINHTTMPLPISIKNETFPWVLDGQASGPHFSVENQAGQ